MCNITKRAVQILYVLLYIITVDKVIFHELLKVLCLLNKYDMKERKIWPAKEKPKKIFMLLQAHHSFAKKRSPKICV